MYIYYTLANINIYFNLLFRFFCCLICCNINLFSCKIVYFYTHKYVKVIIFPTQLQILTLSVDINFFSLVI